ncbi:DUF2855 family protein [Actinokineospora fastidiosa]|uniref:DUF2855 family protein n=1 Tax=Actinokineospora fastidiosa TaxID=1816 RepID=A0A918GSD8_9PSEU|nr:DUF2855 family protein [Actinokineospora fastidiosa]GGS57899.1 hypothetical protein GCM10010171_61150 [Actinokineospora fastidiosa]
MTTVDCWDLLTRKDDLAVGEPRPARVRAPRPGEIRVAVEKFGLTMNSVTYARLGDGHMPFFAAFPAPEGYGRVPVWAFVRVEESNHPGVAVGERYFGFVPISTHHVLPVEPTARGLLDTEPGRAFLPTWYRTFQRVAEPDALDDRRAVFRPIFPLSFHLADFLAGHAERGVKSVLVAGASSKSAIALADLLSRRTDLSVVGLTAPANLGFVGGLGFYDAVAAHDDLASVALAGPAVLVDFTGSHRRIRAAHERFAGELAAVTLVGYTHPESVQALPELAGPEPEFFFAPGVEEETLAAEGEDAFFARYHAEEDRFLAATRSWLGVAPRRGPEAILAGFRALLAGPRPPADTEVFCPR